MKNFANQFNNSDDIDSRVMVMAYAKSLIARLSIACIYYRTFLIYYYSI